MRSETGQGAAGGGGRQGRQAGSTRLLTKPSVQSPDITRPAMVVVAMGRTASTGGCHRAKQSNGTHSCKWAQCASGAA